MLVNIVREVSNIAFKARAFNTVTSKKQVGNTCIVLLLEKKVGNGGMGKSRYSGRKREHKGLFYD
jgi:hypothetical protein